MRALSYDRIYKSQEYLASLGTIQYRSLFGSYSLTVEIPSLRWWLMASFISAPVKKAYPTV